VTGRDELAIATAIALEAGEILTSYFRSNHMGSRAKGERDLVTLADTESEQFVRGRLQEAFPRDGIVGEEGTDDAASSARRWYVDPLDGTLNFAHGVPFWCISIALYEHDQPILGVIHDPLRGDVFTAATGGGAWLNGSPIAVTGLGDLAAAMVHLTIDFNPQSLHAGLEDIRAIAPRVLRTRNTGSAALALAYVAAGYFDAMLHRYAHPWDYGAGVLMVREAGGVVTDIAGEPYTVASVAIVAAASEELRAALSRTISSVAPAAG
jgi:myo-inositol-1(or 4)-monophosphatase